MPEYDESSERWLARETNFADEIEEFWGGDWGVASEGGELKSEA